jgi:hypothetical protein
MANTESACLSYEERWVNLFFQPGKVCCKYCQLLQTYSRPYCVKTGELIVSTDTVGYWCPLLTADERGMITNPETGEVLQT